MQYTVCFKYTGQLWYYSEVPNSNYISQVQDITPVRGFPTPQIIWFNNKKEAKKVMREWKILLSHLRGDWSIVIKD
jgi:hypothetical protein